MVHGRSDEEGKASAKDPLDETGVAMNSDALQKPRLIKG
jgi:hypothetical protein